MNFSLADSVAVLERTPNTLREMLDGLSPKWIDANEGPETFSPFDVIGHLIHGERTDWIARVMAKQYREEIGRRAALPEERQQCLYRNGAREIPS